MRRFAWFVWLLAACMFVACGPKAGPAGPTGRAASDFRAGGIFVGPGTTGLGDPNAVTQTDWWIDPVNGNDTNTGDQTHPIKTHAQLEKRWGLYPYLKTGRTVAGVPCVTVNIVSSLPSSDPVNIRVRLGTDIFLRYVGNSFTALETGTFTSVTPKVRSTNTPNQFTNTALATNGQITTDGAVFNRIRIPSGARAGSWAWVMKDLGTKNARISELTSGNELTGVTDQTITVSDPYQVETLAAITLGDVQVATDSTGFVGTTHGLSFVDLRLDDSAADGISVHQVTEDSLKVSFVGCLINTFSEASFAASRIRLINSAITESDGYLFLGSMPDAYVQAGLYTCPIVVVGQPFFLTDVMQQGSTTHRPGGLLIGPSAVPVIESLGSFDAQTQTNLSISKNPNGDAIVIGGIGASSAKGAGGGLVAQQVVTSGSIWGSGAAGFGIRINAAGFLTYGTVPSVTGTGGDFIVGGASSLTTLRNDTLATVGPITTTWAHLTATYVGGGFNNTAINYSNGATVALIQ